MPIRSIFRGSRVNRDRRDQVQAKTIIARATELHNQDIAAYHAHLENCSQCMNKPFDMCETGKALLEQTGKRR